ncbi:XK-related protein 4 isoform X2 [Eurytemora carolleeae]|uniref:XK-related protein 4 isoform X2 n=1 Tax=Eurytemora carolleeae TaxID=1294199 RepID=UPI000C78442C|nr:XK-related protein 4 isoform X2 [Eurytemora carolleeae]|eukprot:XP_023324676.1 XK-related protein 4-like isoform X2 [Eurytemora affinis]
MTDVLQPKMAGSGIEWIGTRTWKAIKDGTLKTRSLPAETGRRRDEPEQAPFLNGKSREGTDEVDALPETLRYNWFDLLCTLISIVTYIMDLVMDCIVAYYFYHLAVDHGIYHYWYFGLTTFFIVFPSLTMTGFSFRWYLLDSDMSVKRVSTRRWIFRLIILFFQVAPILRYIDSIRYGLLSRMEKCKEERAVNNIEKAKHRKARIKYYTLMVYEDADATLLRLFESFMESAPQLVLQIYILIKDPHANRINNAQLIDEGIDPYLKLTILVLSVTSSLVSLAWSLVVYHRSLRYTFDDKNNITLIGTLFQFLWQFASITARVLALALFASIFPKWIGPFCAAHWLVMSSWIIFQRTHACNSHFEEFLFALVLGAIYIFSFFNAKEEQTRYKYLMYFTFSFLENSALLGIWFWKVEKTAWYVFPALFGHYFAFFGGIMFMLCYYVWFHPTGIEMPFFKFLQGDQRAREANKGEKAKGDVGPITMQSLVASDLEPVEEDIRTSASSPDLKPDTVDGTAGLNLDRLRRSYSVPPRARELMATRKLKYMGQLSQDSV